MKNKSKISAAIVLITTFLLAAAPPSATRAQNKERLNEEIKKFAAYYRQAVTDYGIVGSSFMLIHDNQILDRRFYGTAHLENKTPVDENTIYHWASITKTFTGIAVMQLRDRGKLSLDDPIVKYVPEIRKVHNSFGKTEEITIRHLLSHTAGFRAGTFPWGGDKDWHPSEPPGWAQVAAMLPYTEVEFKPGSRYSYSNPGIVFLGKAIEQITGEDYEVYTEKNILRPLEMHRSYFDRTPYHLLKHRSHSYRRTAEDELKPFRFDMDTGVTVSNGGLNAPLGDMAKYVDFLMDNPKKADVYNGVLQRSSLEEMWQPVADVPAEKNYPERREKIALAYFLEEMYGMRLVGHSGGQNGFTTHFYLHPESRTAYIVAFNTWTSPTKDKPNRLTSRLDREIKENLFQNVFPLLQKPEAR